MNKKEQIKILFELRYVYSEDFLLELEIEEYLKKYSYKELLKYFKYAKTLSDEALNDVYFVNALNDDNDEVQAIIELMELDH
jgi:hypothetical protein